MGMNPYHEGLVNTPLTPQELANVEDGFDANRLAIEEHHHEEYPHQVSSYFLDDWGLFK
jgi:hypothetical protein